MPFYERGDVCIHYEEVGSGFPLMVIPGGGLNSRVSNWPNAVINAMEAFKNDFRCITKDQRNANGGESTGPVAVDDPWSAFAEDQLGLMDHLGIRFPASCAVCDKSGELAGDYSVEGRRSADTPSGLDDSEPGMSKKEEQLADIEFLKGVRVTILMVDFNNKKAAII